MIIRDQRDSQMIEDVECYFKLINITPQDRILDIGGHIGAFGKRSVEFGAKNILAIEPYWENANLYHINVPEAIVITAGVGNESGPSELFLHDDDHAGHSFIVQYEKSVPSFLISFKELLKFNPTIIKSDCEGTEEILNWCIVPDSVKQIVIEIHNKEFIEPIKRMLKIIDFNFIHSDYTSVFAWNR